MMAMVGITALSILGPDMGFWEGFYFACFVAGLLLSIVSLIGGMGHISWHFHPPHVPGAAHLPHGGRASRRGRGGRGFGDDSVVECVFDHDLSLLVRGFRDTC